MAAVFEREIDWLRERNGLAGTLAYAIPGSFQVYGAIDLTDDVHTTEDVLLDALAPSRTAELIAGWIDRGPWPPPEGDEYILYWGWRYRFQRVQPLELAGLPAEGEGSFPDLLFPTDRAWLVSLLWDDPWRSVGTDAATAQRLEQQLPTFHRLSPSADLAATGRTPN